MRWQRAQDRRRIHERLFRVAGDSVGYHYGGGVNRSSDNMRYAMIIEQGERNYSAYLPDLPGCIATGKTIEQLKTRMSEAIELHLRGMREDGLPIPEPTSLAEYVEAA